MEGEASRIPKVGLSTGRMSLPYGDVKDYGGRSRFGRGIRSLHWGMLHLRGIVEGRSWGWVKSPNTEGPRTEP